jgi:transcriptional regulator with XRE-family HTH domain
MLAEKSITSARTLQRILQGRPGRIATFKKIADALKVNCDSLLRKQDDGNNQSGTSLPASQSLGFKITFEIAFPFALFDETSTLPGLLEALAREVKQNGQVNVNLVKPGSVVIDSQWMQEADVRALVRAFCNRSLQSLAICYLDLSGAPIDVTSDVAATVDPLIEGKLRGPREAGVLIGTRDLWEIRILEYAVKYVPEGQLIIRYLTDQERILSLRTTISPDQLAIAHFALKQLTADMSANPSDQIALTFD